MVVHKLHHYTKLGLQYATVRHDGKWSECARDEEVCIKHMVIIIIIVVISLVCHYGTAAWNRVEIISHYVINRLSSQEQAANRRKGFKQMKEYRATDRGRGNHRTVIRSAFAFLMKGAKYHEHKVCLSLFLKPLDGSRRHWNSDGRKSGRKCTVRR